MPVYLPRSNGGITLALPYRLRLHGGDTSHAAPRAACRHAVPPFKPSRPGMGRGRGWRRSGPPPPKTGGTAMNSIRSLASRLLSPAWVKLGAVATAAALATAIGFTAATSANATSKTFSFGLQASSAAITACLPNAAGHVTITTEGINDTMKVSISGMPPNTGFDLFVIQQH